MSTTTPNKNYSQLLKAWRDKYFHPTSLIQSRFLFRYLKPADGVTYKNFAFKSDIEAKKATDLIKVRLETITSQFDAKPAGFQRKDFIKDFMREMRTVSVQYGYPKPISWRMVEAMNSAALEKVAVDTTLTSAMLNELRMNQKTFSRMTEKSKPGNRGTLENEAIVAAIPEIEQRMRMELGRNLVLSEKKQAMVTAIMEVAETIAVDPKMLTSIDLTTEMSDSTYYRLVGQKTTSLGVRPGRVVTPSVAANASHSNDLTNVPNRRVEAFYDDVKNDAEAALAEKVTSIDGFEIGFSIWNTDETSSDDLTNKNRFLHLESNERLQPGKRVVVDFKLSANLLCYVALLEPAGVAENMRLGSGFGPVQILLGGEKNPQNIGFDARLSNEYSNPAYGGPGSVFAYRSKTPFQTTHSHIDNAYRSFLPFILHKVYRVPTDLLERGLLADCATTREILKYIPRGCKPRAIWILDNHSSHTNFQIGFLCKLFGVQIRSLPSNTTSISQPLDVGLNDPIKVGWKRKVQAHDISRSNEGTRKQVVNYLSETMHNIEVKTDKIEEAFRNAGLYPYISSTIPIAELERKKLYEDENNMKARAEALHSKAPESLKSRSHMKAHGLIIDAVAAKTALEQKKHRELEAAKAYEQEQKAKNNLSTKKRKGVVLSNELSFLVKQRNATANVLSQTMFPEMVTAFKKWVDEQGRTEEGEEGYTELANESDDWIEHVLRAVQVGGAGIELETQEPTTESASADPDDLLNGLDLDDDDDDEEEEEGEAIESCTESIEEENEKDISLLKTKIVPTYTSDDRDTDAQGEPIKNVDELNAMKLRFHSCKQLTTSKYLKTVKPVLESTPGRINGDTGHITEEAFFHATELWAGEGEEIRKRKRRCKSTYKKDKKTNKRSKKKRKVY